MAESPTALAQGDMGRLFHPAHPEQPLGQRCPPEGFPWQGTQGQLVITFCRRHSSHPPYSNYLGDGTETQSTGQASPGALCLPVRLTQQDLLCLAPIQPVPGMALLLLHSRSNVPYLLEPVSLLSGAVHLQIPF